MNRYANAGPKPGHSILARIDADMAAVFRGDDDADSIARGLGAIQMPDDVLPWDDDIGAEE